MNELARIDAQMIDNQSQRTPCVLVLDGSTSMGEGGRIQALNAALRQLEADLKVDPTTCDRVRILVLRFGDDSRVTLLSDWTDAAHFVAPTMVANGSTPLGAAMLTAARMVEEEKGRLRQAGIPLTRPWVFMMTDGEPDPGWEPAAEATRQAAMAGKFVLWPIAVGEANTANMQRFQAPGQQVFTAKNANFREMFVWLTASLAQVSRNRPGGHAQIEAPPARGLVVAT